MIDWKTILSSFDDKPTLLQWLKIVEKALENASLEDVAIKNTGNNMYVFEFKFADGSTVTSSPINFLKEISGIEKVSDEIVGTQTVTTVRVNYIDGTSDDFPVAAENGRNGNDGKEGKAGKGVTRFEDISDEIVGNQTYTTVRVHYTDGTTNDINIAAENGKGIRNINTISHEISGNQTVTKIRVYYTDGTTTDFSVYAENGSGGGGGGSKLYLHEIVGTLDDSAMSAYYIRYLSSNSTKVQTLSDLKEFIAKNKCFLVSGAPGGGAIYYTAFNLNGNVHVIGLKSDGGLVQGDVKTVGDEVSAIC